MVCWMNGRATAESAVKVVSRFANSSAWVCAAGRTILAARASAGNSARSRVRASLRFRATGSRLVSSRGARLIASFRSKPRPASPSPKPISELRAP
jgi:hypothetical protein